MSWRSERDAAAARATRWTETRARTAICTRMIVLHGFISSGLVTIELTAEEQDAIQYLIDEHGYTLAGNKIKEGPDGQR